MTFRRACLRRCVFPCEDLQLARTCTSNTSRRHTRELAYERGLVHATFLFLLFFIMKKQGRVPMRGPCFWRELAYKRDLAYIGIILVCAPEMMRGLANRRELAAATLGNASRWSRIRSGADGEKMKYDRCAVNEQRRSLTQATQLKSSTLLAGSERSRS